MRGRTSRLVLAAGLVVVLALAIGLVRLTRGTTQAATPVLAAREIASQPAAEAPSHIAPSTNTPARRPAPSAPRARAATPARQPELAPAPASFGRELKRDANGKLVPIITVGELKEQFHRTDAAMNACIQRSGQAPSGKATLAFSVSAKDNKLIIETTGVHDEDTLAGHPELLDCMHRTANELVLDGRPVPELGTPIYVRRHVRLENGVLAENTIFNFSYNP
jgi:hypothetical protein